MKLPILVKNPWEIFSTFSNARFPFLFSGGTEPGQGRYSYMGADPCLMLRTDHGVTKTTSSDGSEELWPDPFSALSELTREIKRDRGPFPFSGGWAGYLSYDLKDILLPGKVLKRTEKAPEQGIPLALLGLYDTVVVVDHHKDTAHIVSDDSKGAGERAGELKERIEGATNGNERVPSGPESNPPPPAPLRPVFNLTRETYISLVERAKEYIAEGDIYQINIAKRIKIPYPGDPFSLYRRLVEINPAPMSSYFDCGPFQVVSNSPERLLMVRGGQAVTEPIKGTRPRGATLEADERLKRELKESTKERAEHVMIVDLERNDIGSISETGSIEVEGFQRIETFAGLHHMVSTVSGRLRSDIDAAEALKRIFPGGSITGAPKIRAIEIIDELEPARRGVYTGAVGWMDLSGETDMAVAIRTGILKDGSLSLGVGSGIVADSIPEDEHDETLLKARDFLRATETAHTAGAGAAG